MDWQVYILLHAVLSAIQILQFRSIARIKTAANAGFAINAISFSTLFVCGIATSLFIGGVQIHEFTDIWYLYVIAAVAFVMALYLLYKAMVYLESATVSVLGTSSALFTLILASILFNESLTSRQVGGSLLLLPCIWYVLLLARKHHKKLSFHNMAWLHGFGYAITSSLCLSVAHVTEKEIFKTSSVGTYVIFGWLLQATFAWVLYLVFGRHAANTIRDIKIINRAVILGLLRFGAGIFFIYALIGSDNVTLVTVIANSRIVVVAVLAGWLLGERNFYYKKLAAAAVSVIALSIIFWN